MGSKTNRKRFHSDNEKNPYIKRSWYLKYSNIKNNFDLINEIKEADFIGGSGAIFLKKINDPDIPRWKYFIKITFKFIFFPQRNFFILKY